MHNKLKKIYFLFLAPAVFGFVAVVLTRQIRQPICLHEQFTARVAPVIFILTAVFAVAGPIFYRALFAHRQRRLTKVPLNVLYKFERNQTCMALVAPYLALAGYLLQVPHFHLSGTLLMALYAIYYHYPLGKKIRFDGKLFRADQAPPVRRIRG